MGVSVQPPHNGQRIVYPRPLSSFEQDSLLWLLPPERRGYDEYRKYVESWSVVGPGRRGAGNYILAEPGLVPDIESPLPQVFAYGMIETDQTGISVTLRELFVDQLEFEIAALRGDSVPEKYTERRRWTFSTWAPRSACPVCGVHPRQVIIRRVAGAETTLAICEKDKRLWIYDAADGVNHLIPVTNFHNAIMLHKNIRDPELALSADNFFRQLHSFTDEDLTAGFVQYNKLRKKLDLGAVAMPARGGRTLLRRLFSLFGK